MPNFCPKCGAPSAGSAFCAACGANLSAPPAAAPSPAAVPAAPPVANYVPPPPRQGMSTFAKVAIVFLVLVVFAGAAGVVGVIYIAHRVKQKVNEATGGLLANS